ncbi:hypothetical protein [Teredinibacter sp. KSP-S5-2]|uniref:hypothetical protein n=1 Tax=Teredinibacter sp. KSP-S5-2 TaxID=3034506 RepID=UPI002934C4AD|nr:hypothetical protein [Teredinibacter sp. KSP-S5-2]WNO07927.1 hypothetical protein P5V12_13165 [Teredinibacter sp. KSP-S5-2]
MNKSIKLISETWVFYKSYFYGIFRVLAPVFLPLTLIDTLIIYWPPSSTIVLWSFLIAKLLVYPSYQGALIFYLGSIISGKTQTVSSCYEYAKLAYPKLLTVYCLYSLVVSAGFFLLIIPGLILASRLLIADFMCVYDGKEGTEALNSSIEKTRSYQWTILMGILVLAIFIGVPAITIEVLLKKINLLVFPTELILNIAIAFLTPLFTVFGFRIYTYQLSVENRELGTPKWNHR